MRAILRAGRAARRPRPRGRGWPGPVAGLAMLGSLAAASAGPAGVGTTDLVLFPFAQQVQHSSPPHPQGGHGKHRTEHTRLGLDAFLLAERRGWRVLAEALATDEGGHVERLQVGRELGQALLWLGRFHSPAMHWNELFHHAPFLRTSVTGPSLMAFDDHGGPLPTHLWGLLTEWTRPAGAGQWQLQAGAGLGPRLSGEGLDPAEALRPGGGRREALALSWNWFPDAFGTDMLGLHLAYARIPGRLPAVSELRQQSLGLFVDRNVGPSRWLANVQLLRHRTAAPAGSGTYRHWGGFLQGELLLGRWRPYARIERNALDRADPYWIAFPGTAVFQAVGGVRLEMGQHQALTLEAAGTRELGGHHWHDSWRLQWSALLP